MTAQPSIWTRDFTLLVLGAFLQGFSFYCLLPALPLFITDVLDGSSDEVGLVLGSFSLTAVLLRPFAGYLLDRYGRRVWQLWSSGLFAAFMLLYFFADSLQMLTLCRLLHGAAWGMIGVASATVVADLVPATRRGSAMGYYGLAMPLALSIGPMLGAWVLHDTRYDLLFALCFVLAVGAWLCFFAVRTPTVKAPGIRFEWSRLFELKVLRLFVFMLLLCVGFGGWVTFVPLYARELGFASSGPLFSSYAVAVLAIRFWGGRWYDRFGPKSPIFAGLAFLMAGWLLLSGATGTVMALVGATLLGLGFGVVMPPFNAMAIDLVTADRRGAANALVFTAYDIGIAIGSVALGYAAVVWDLSAIFLISGSLTAVATLTFGAWTLPHFRKYRLQSSL